MKIGIGITTRNRPDVMRLASEHHAAFRPADSRFVVVNDCSTVSYDCFDPRIIDAEVVNNQQRLGIAKSKNECIKRLSDCDWVFLFDDDAFPRCHGWADAFISACLENNVHHLMYLKNVGQVQRMSSSGGIDIYQNSLGCMLMFSRKALNVLGGYDIRFGFYGFEHAQLSCRAHVAKLTPANFVTIPNAWKYIYAMDVEYSESNPPPIGRMNVPFHATLSCNDKEASIRVSAPYYGDLKVRMEI